MTYMLQHLYFRLNEGEMRGTNERLELNRRVLQLMGNMNVIPWKFEYNGLLAKIRVSKLRWTLLILTFWLSMAYSLHITLHIHHVHILGTRVVCGTCREAYAAVQLCPGQPKYAFSIESKAAFLLRSKILNPAFVHNSASEATAVQSKS